MIAAELAEIEARAKMYTRYIPGLGNYLDGSRDVERLCREVREMWAKATDGRASEADLRREVLDLVAERDRLAAQVAAMQAVQEAVLDAMPYLIVAEFLSCDREAGIAARLRLIEAHVAALAAAAAVEKEPA